MAVTRLLVIAGVAVALAGVTSELGLAKAPAGRVRHCKGLDVGNLQVWRLRTNGSCSSARSTLRRLLARGIGGLPVHKTSRSAWVCGKRGSTRFCRKSARAHGESVVVRIVFRLRARSDGSGAPPTPPPSPPPAPPGVVPAPQECLDFWNADTSHAFIDDGLHFYADHNVRKAWVFHAPEGQLEVCAVIFVVLVTDPEYGTDGEVRKLTGEWQLMNYYFGDPVAKQGEAPDHANASLDASGKLAPL